MDARLVSIEAELEGIAEREGHGVLMLREGSLVVPAELPVPLNVLPPLRAGSLLRVTGVCQIQVGPQRRFARFFQPESARLLLRGVEDITILRAASWWTSQRLAGALMAAVGVLVVAVLWLSSLHRRNIRLQAEISAREQAEAEVKRRIDERQLLAADLHDSLEQSLTGVAFQLQAARDALDSDEVDAQEAHVTLAERLLAHSRAEVHRAVRELRSPSQQSPDLPAALRELIRLSSAASKVQFSLALPEPLAELPGHIAYTLLRIAQEAVTNALKHARASHIGIALTKEPRSITLSIQDDGISFDPGSSPGPAQGHFGLQGIKERVARLAGTLRLESQPQHGTRITATLPLPS
jgi:signal transduction histidine kinase